MILEDFSRNADILAAPPRTDADLFDRGYSQGWEDAAAKIRADDLRVAARLATHLEAMTHSQGAAVSLCLAQIEPLLSEIFDKMLPRAADPRFSGPHPAGGRDAARGGGGEGALPSGWPPRPSARSTHSSKPAMPISTRCASRRSRACHRCRRGSRIPARNARSTSPRSWKRWMTPSRISDRPKGPGPMNDATPPAGHGRARALRPGAGRDHRLGRQGLPERYGAVGAGAGRDPVAGPVRVPTRWSSMPAIA